MLYKVTTGEQISRQQFLFRLAEDLAGDFQSMQQKEREDIQEKSMNVGLISFGRKESQMRYCKENKTTKIYFKCKKYQK